MDNNRIRLLPDLHLELMLPSKCKNINLEDLFSDSSTEWKEEILVLAGDIGDPFSPFYSKFIKLCSSSFGNIVLVAGNHEYYNS